MSVKDWLDVILQTIAIMVSVWAALRQTKPKHRK